MPTLTKVRIVEDISDRIGFTKEQAKDAVETLLEIVKRTLESGENVLATGFGKFSVKQKGERRGRNPATRERMMLPARKVVTFKCSGILRERVNGGR